MIGTFSTHKPVSPLSWLRRQDLPKFVTTTRRADGHIPHTPGPSAEQNGYVSVSEIFRNRPRRPVYTVPVRIGDLTIGSGNTAWIAGPHYVESIDQMLASASMISDLGGSFIRARAYWPGAKENDFQRHLAAGLKVLKATAKHFGLLVVSRIVAERDLELMTTHCDVLEVQPRSPADFHLLYELGCTEKAVLLNRHPLMPVEQFLHGLEYLQKEGRSPILLAESGIRGFAPFSARKLDLSLVTTLQRKTHYPVLFDCTPIPVSMLSAADLIQSTLSAGADGVIAASPTSDSSRDSLGTLALAQLREIIHQADMLTRSQHLLRTSPITSCIYDNSPTKEAAANV